MGDCCSVEHREKSDRHCINDQGWKYKCPKCGINCLASWHYIWSCTACVIKCERCRVIGVLGDSMVLHVPPSDMIPDGFEKDCRELLSMRAKELERLGKLPDYEALEWS